MKVKTETQNVSALAFYESKGFREARGTTRRVGATKISAAIPFKNLKRSGLKASPQAGP